MVIKKIQLVKDLHAKIRQKIEKKNEQYPFIANRGYKLVKWWFKDESFWGEREWCDPSNT
jgi:hypothetical protein